MGMACRTEWLQVGEVEAQILAIMIGDDMIDLGGFLDTSLCAVDIVGIAAQRLIGQDHLPYLLPLGRAA